jgi:hypothetical protein
MAISLYKLLLGQLGQIDSNNRLLVGSSGL